MTGVFLILFISCVFFPCQGQITSPPDGSNQTVLPGSTVTIIWSFEDKLSGVSLRQWRFTSSDGSFQKERLARFIDDGDPEYFNIGLSGVSIAKPATLVLKNVNQTYDGTYQFTISGRSSAVVVFIARKPTVTINCSNPITVKEDHDLICLCKGENGNPPADVIWYDKNDDPIGPKEKEQKALVLRSVTDAERGTYTCKAQSYTLMDEKSIEVNVALNFKPNETDIEFSRNPAIIGEEIKITCSSKGQPNPSFTITHNGTINITGVEEMYTKQDVNWNDAGYYTCVAMNKLGSDQSDSKFLNVTVQGPTSPSTASSSSSSSTVSQGSGTGITDDRDDDGLPPGAIAGIVIGVLVFVVIIIVVVYYFKTRERSGYKGNANVRPGGNERNEADENAYDSVAPSRASGSKDKPPKGEAPVLYSTVDKDNRQGRPLYATLDEAALQSQGSSRTPDEAHPEPTQYASIEFGREVPRADLV